jgi:hypothetical protein
MRTLWYIAVVIIILTGFSCEEDNYIRRSIINNTEYPVSIKIKSASSHIADTITIRPGEKRVISKHHISEYNGSFYPLTGIDSLRFLQTENLLITANLMNQKNWALIGKKQTAASDVSNELVYTVRPQQIWLVSRKNQ